MNLLTGSIYHGHRRSHLLRFTWYWTMEQYHDSTDSWEMEILQDVGMVYSCHEISDMLEGDYIHLASDGSASDGGMSFAWK
eukprot:6653163-Ditylum_brightwellii.AAC.1